VLAHLPRPAQETQELLELQAQLEMQQCLQGRAELEILA